MEERRLIQPVGQEQQSRLSPRVCNGEKAVWTQATRLLKLHPSHSQWDAEAVEETLDSQKESAWASLSVPLFFLTPWSS